MKSIELARGVAVIVDSDNFDDLIKYKWSLDRDGYVIRRLYKTDGTRTSTTMHRDIMRPSKNDDIQVDHINGDKLDNRKENLRICSRSENCMNKGIYANNKSGFKGVCWHKSSNKWVARISINKKQKTLGSFTSPELAHQAYCNAAKNHHGVFAKTK